MKIDGNNLIVGRAGSFIAKKLMLGESIDLINCQNMVITGNKKNVLAKYKRIKSMGVPSKGPFLSKRPDMLVRRIMRGMLPYKQFKGKEAFKRLKCYIDSPEKIEGDAQSIDKANVSKVPNMKYIKIIDICRELGWQK